jgi:hypothetical protein
MIGRHGAALVSLFRIYLGGSFSILLFTGLVI